MPGSLRTLFKILILCSLPLSASAEIYRWVDESGRVHFSDTSQNKPGQIEVKLKTEKLYWKKLEIDVDGKGGKLTESDTSRIQQDVNNVYRFYDQKLYFDIYKTVPVKVVVYSDFNSYNTFVRSKSNMEHGRTSGMFFRRDNLIAIYLRENMEQFYRTLKHETSHAVVHILTDYLPSWLNEGLAENMETLISRDGELIIQHHSHNYKRVRMQFEKGSLMGIREFLSLTSGDWQAEDRNSDYILHSQAGELTRMLLSSPSQRSFITQLIHGFKRGSRVLTFALVEKEYIGGLSVMQTNWDNWVRREEQLPIRL
ncbi:DUF4124 domain-containing protein [Hahella ganghwensis]|uniref:DUF4124 domain-containing protein n=1 Tax=Hahella ganghwensis TaxID=286420 RepID=UPI0003A20A7C|nr:DUF4124 domain-containing protein [Hahella ganghwensis]